MTSSGIVLQETIRTVRKIDFYNRLQRITCKSNHSAVSDKKFFILGNFKYNFLNKVGKDE